jgi:predicted  nucleic acid-binding Zn-ribbon protein
MRQIDFKTKMEALDLYFQGFSADQVVTKASISKGTVISILRDAKEGRFPGLELKDRIDELHNLSVRLRREGVDLVQAKLGFGFLKRLSDMNVEPDRVEEWIGFCSELSPTPPDGFLPAAMELFQIEKETGKSYAEIASEVKELFTQREKLIKQVGDLQAKEIRASELKDEIEGSEKEVDKLRAEKSKLESRVSSLRHFLEKRAEKLRVPLSELEEKLGELVSLKEEIASRTEERNKLEGELEALNERYTKFSSRMEKASSDFERDVKLIGEARDELARIAEMKGRYEQEIEDMEWAKRILPFLSDPDKVADKDFSLVPIVVNCLDKWIQAQPEWRYGTDFVTLGKIKDYVQSKRI